MSVLASIDLHLIEKDVNNKTINIIQILMSYGWSVFHGEFVGFLPLGDKDDFDWNSEKGLTFKDLKQIIEAKEAVGEIVGISMNWKGTEVGGDFLFWPKDKYEAFSVNLHGIRRTIKLDNNYEITDFQWYLSKLLVPLNKVWSVEYFSFDEHI